MKVKIISFDKKSEDSIELNDEIFGLPMRKDILQRVVRWQLAKKQQGTHQTRTIDMISGTTKKPFKQKGTGNARQGSLRSPHMRKGAVVFGPVTRSHAYNLPKAIRKLGLKTALSAKLAEGKLHIIDKLELGSAKSKELKDSLKKIGISSVLFVDGEKIDGNLSKAANSMYKVDVLPQIGANVYDILNHEDLVLSVDAVKKLEERLV